MMVLAWAQQNYNQYGNEGEVPAVLSYNSPLRQPDSLRSRPYFDFLSTLYRRDTDKTQLFRPYLTRTRREIVDPASLSAEIAKHFPQSTNEKDRSRRAIVFRPLFVYKQQEIKKQQVQNRKRRV